MKKPRENTTHDAENRARPQERGADGGIECGCPTGDCRGVERREFLKTAGVGLIGATLGSAGTVMAGAFTPADVRAGHLVPADKKLRPEWVRSLFERGTKEVYRGAGLDNIGMPCGGIGSGQLYLCGDGTLGSWQIFNRATSNWVEATGSTYRHRGIPKPLAQGFAVAVRSGAAEARVNVLSKEGFGDVSFRGEYPIATVAYEDDEVPVRVEMEAFSPFIPLEFADSGLPATLFRITVENTSSTSVRASVLGWLENAVCATSSAHISGKKVSTVLDERGHRFLLHGVAEDEAPVGTPAREPILFESFEGASYEGWTVEGTAFGERPAPGTLTGQQAVSGFDGEGLVNTFLGGDVPQGKLTSKPFKIERAFVNLKIGGGANRGETGVRLVVDGKLARSGAGGDAEHLDWLSWYVQDLAGHEAHIEIIDDSTIAWGHILVDQIEFSDTPRQDVASALERAFDYGSMALACAQPARGLPKSNGPLPQGTDVTRFSERGATRVPIGEPLVGLIRSEEAELKPGEKQSFTFALAWHFPNAKNGHAYAERFPSAHAVASYVLDNEEPLAGGTRLWRDAYYDSTLPYWLLDRLHSTVSTLATGTCQWWANGRFWAYEGVTCCDGTCTHVWNYAHAHARLFPELARSIRELQDFHPREEGGGFHPDTGLVGFRSDDNYAADGQCGSVLKAYREYQMSPDDSFLQRFWPRVRKALEYSILQDANNDGLIENTQHNTYDINYHGANTFVGSLYLAALRAGEEMARDVGDESFARHCRAVFESGSRLTQERLWDGEYFTQDVDLSERKQHQYGPGCLSDHLFGQGWAHQLGLGYIYPQAMVRSGLRSVWKYNWAPDIAPYNEVHKPLRWFISPGDAGLFTCTWPKSEFLPRGTVYKSEVWTGIEYQAAGHMIAEGMVTEGLAVCRAIHDRYQPERYNPYNEIECGDHYARALASWGVYLSLCGYEHHGPKRHIGFAPRIKPENFKAAFTAAEGWGSFEQRREGKRQEERISVLRGRLRVKTLAFAVQQSQRVVSARVTVAGKPVAAGVVTRDGRVEIGLAHEVTARPGEDLEVTLEL